MQYTNLDVLSYAFLETLCTVYNNAAKIKEQKIDLRTI